jgi:hypothetical protein
MCWEYWSNRHEPSTDNLEFDKHIFLYFYGNHIQSNIPIFIEISCQSYSFKLMSVVKFIADSLIVSDWDPEIVLIGAVFWDWEDFIFVVG